VLLRESERASRVPTSRMATDMQMVMIVFRNSLEDEVLAVLRGLDVIAYTDLPKVFGVGEAGMAFHSFVWPGFNSIILAALEDGDAARLVRGLVTFRDAARARQDGATIPLRVFVLPCDQAL
jgi:hypothetical protein